MSDLKELIRIDCKVSDKGDYMRITKGSINVVYWKKKRWFSGKGITDGRGLEDLVKQLSKSSGNIQDFYTNNPEGYNHLIGIFQKHTKINLTIGQAEAIKSEMAARFNIKLKNS